MVNTSKARDHGLGHVQLELRRGYDSELAWLGTRREKVPEYVTALEESYGEAKAKEVLWDGPPHALIFPNLFLGEMNLAIIQPMTDATCEHFHTPLLLEGVDDSLNQRILRQSEAAMGPAGFLLPDDAVIAERMQMGFAAGMQDGHAWIDLSRGIGRERTDEAGLVSHVSDEVTSRGFWSHYLYCMTARQ